MRLRSHVLQSYEVQKRERIWKHFAWLASCSFSVTVETLFCPVISCTDHSVSLGRMFSDMHCISSTNLLILCKEEKAEKNDINEWPIKEGKERKWESEEREENKRENGKRQSKRRDGMRLGELRHRDGEKWCGNSRLLSCSPQPCAAVCLPSSSSARKALQGQEGCLLAFKEGKGAAGLPLTCWY